MKQSVNIVYKPLFKNKTRFFILMGGRGAGRSTVASQYALAQLISTDYFRCAIMRYVFGDIRNSIFREIEDRCEENEVDNKLEKNSSLMSFSYAKNTINAVGFRKSSGDQKAKLKSLANYNCIIIEEAEEIPEEDFIQLVDSLRTVKGDIKIILLLNPPNKEHWIIEKWFDLEEIDQKGFFKPILKPEIKDTTFIWTSYLDNIKNISEQSVRSYEEYKVTKPSHYWNMIKGYVTETVKGKIYTGWRIIDSVPHEARLERYGLDFGYTNDPTAICSLYYYNGGYIIDEILHRKGMSNKMIADTLQIQPQAIVMADSAEPKSIEEISQYGIAIFPCIKGQGSVSQGINFVQSQRISLTKRSINFIKSYQNYTWMTDKDGNIINKPDHHYSDAMDAVRYAFNSIAINEDQEENIIYKEENYDPY